MHRQPDRPSGGRCPETVLSKASRPVSLGYVARVWADGPVRGNSYSTLGGWGLSFHRPGTQTRSHGGRDLGLELELLCVVPKCQVIFLKRMTSTQSLRGA